MDGRDFRDYQEAFPGDQAFDYIDSDGRVYDQMGRLPEAAFQNWPVRLESFTDQIRQHIDKVKQVAPQNRGAAIVDLDGMSPSQLADVWDYIDSTIPAEDLEFLIVIGDPARH